MQQEPERILRIRTVLARSGLSRSTLYRKMEKGTFPKQIRISEYCAGWRESELNHWIADPPAWRSLTAHALTPVDLTITPRTAAKIQVRADD